jgi:hypothetical protein
MKVRQLLDLLADYDEDLEVRIMSQSSWPFENSVHGVCDREEMGEEDDDPDDPNTQPNAVFVVEGRQLCYGNKNAWSVT